MIYLAIFAIICALASLWLIRFGKMAKAKRTIWLGRIGVLLSALLLAALSKSFWLLLLVGFVGGGRLVMEYWQERVRADNFGMGSLDEDETEAASRGYQQADKKSRSQMSRQEALQILGLQEPVGADEVEEAWKRLIAKSHPDKGGSDWLAAKINEARERLLS